jgi:pimeloyl-ACP methyl ester carboxylesterase
MANFVLVHGAWIGGWCWRPNAQALRKAGHEVFTPTLTGLGERSHLMNPSINLDTHIADIVNVIKHEELSDVVLVGHSYGGMVVTGVADALAEKIRSLVYLDAFVPESGQALVDLAAAGAETSSRQRLHPGAAARRGLRRQAGSGGLCRCTHVAAPGRLLRSTGQAHRRHRSHQEENLHLRQRSGADRLYAVLRKGQKRWTVHTLPCTHLVQIDMPDELTALLLQEV